MHVHSMLEYFCIAPNLLVWVLYVYCINYKKKKYSASSSVITRFTHAHHLRLYNAPRVLHFSAFISIVIGLSFLPLIPVLVLRYLGMGLVASFMCVLRLVLPLLRWWMISHYHELVRV